MNNREKQRISTPHGRGQSYTMTDIVRDFLVTHSLTTTSIATRHSHMKLQIFSIPRKFQLIEREKNFSNLKLKTNREEKKLGKIHLGQLHNVSIAELFFAPQTLPSIFLPTKIWGSLLSVGENLVKTRIEKILSSTKPSLESDYRRHHSSFTSQFFSKYQK